MNSVLTIQNQNLLDVSIQTDGSPFGIIEYCKRNGIAVTTKLDPGTELIKGDAPIDPDIADYFTSNGIKPATDPTHLPCYFEGIGYMSIEGDFVVGAECSNGIGSDRIGVNFKVT